MKKILYYMVIKSTVRFIEVTSAMERCVASDESTRKCRYTASRVTLRLNVIERTSVAPDFPDLPLVQEEVPGFNDALVSMTRRSIFWSCMSIALLTLQGLYPVSLMISATIYVASMAKNRRIVVYYKT